GRGAFMHLAHLVAFACVIEDPLGRRRFAGIDVGHDAEIAVILDRVAARHKRLIPNLSLIITSDNVKTPGWPPPCGACPRASSRGSRDCWIPRAIRPSAARP